MRGTAWVILPLVAVTATATAGETKPAQIGVAVLDQTRNSLPLRLTCPRARVSCAGTASFRGTKERGRKTYRLRAGPTEFDEIAAGRRRTIKFRITDDAREILERARGMRVTVSVQARYGAGEPGTVRVRTELEP